MGKKSLDLRGARALVTGATGGLGHAIARALHAEGAGLVLTGRRAEPLADLAAELGAQTVTADLADPAEGRRLLEEAGDVDVLVLNHALPATGFLTDLSPEQVQRLVDINLTSQVLLAQAAVPAMAARGRGHVVVMSSLYGKVTGPGTTMYNATKFGLRGFALALRQDLHGTGVGVSLVHPGFVREAGMWADGGLDTPPGMSTVSPQQVAEAVVKVIRKDKAQVDVAPASLKGTAALALVAPEATARLARVLTPKDFTEKFISGTADKQ